MSVVTVDAEWLIERVASRVVELLDQRGQQPSELVDAATLARLLGVSRSTVYDNAAKLGARQLGDGSRARLRFDVEQARQAWTRRVSSERSEPAEVPAPAPVRRRRRSEGSAGGPGLLPVKDREVA